MGEWLGLGGELGLRGEERLARSIPVRVEQ